MMIHGEVLVEDCEVGLLRSVGGSDWRMLGRDGEAGRVHRSSGVLAKGYESVGSSLLSLLSGRLGERVARSLPSWGASGQGVGHTAPGLRLVASDSWKMAGAGVGLVPAGANRYLESRHVVPPVRVRSVPCQDDHVPRHREL